MKKSTVLFFIVIVIGLLYSCRSTKKIQTVVTPKKDTVVVVTPPVVNLHAHEDSIAFMKDNYNRVLANRINFLTFSAKIDVDYEDAEGKKYNVNAHLRMLKDSVIWISITGPLGIEGLRAYIT